MMPSPESQPQLEPDQKGDGELTPEQAALIRFESYAQSTARMEGLREQLKLSREQMRQTARRVIEAFSPRPEFTKDNPFVSLGKGNSKVLITRIPMITRDTVKYGLISQHGIYIICFDDDSWEFGNDTYKLRSMDSMDSTRVVKDSSTYEALVSLHNVISQAYRENFGSIMADCKIEHLTSDSYDNPVLYINRYGKNHVIGGRNNTSKTLTFSEADNENDFQYIQGMLQMAEDSMRKKITLAENTSDAFNSHLPVAYSLPREKTIFERAKHVVAHGFGSLVSKVKHSE